MGGSGGGGHRCLPAALTGLATTQLDNGAGFSASPAGSYLGNPPTHRTSSPSWHSIRVRASTSKSRGIESNFRTTTTAAPSRPQHPERRGT